MKEDLRIGVFKGGSIIGGSLQKQIIELLKEEIVLYTSQIARKLKRYPNQIYYALLALERRGLIERYERYEQFRPETRPIKVVYWYLPENRDKALKILKVI